MRDPLALKEFQKKGVFQFCTNNEDTPACLQQLRSLVENREVFICRLNNNQLVGLTRHLMFCVQTICPSIAITEEVQHIYGWLLENPGSTLAEVQAALQMPQQAFGLAVEELTRGLLITPIKLMGAPCAPLTNWSDDALWVTAEYWYEGLARPACYSSIAYCMYEMNRIVKPLVSSRMLNRILYQSA